MIDIYAFPAGSIWRNKAVDLLLSNTEERIQRRINRLNKCLGKIYLLKIANHPKIKYEEEYEDEDPSFKGLCENEQE